MDWGIVSSSKNPSPFLKGGAVTGQSKVMPT